MDGQPLSRKDARKKRKLERLGGTPLTQVRCCECERVHTKHTRAPGVSLWVNGLVIFLLNSNPLTISPNSRLPAGWYI